MQYAKRQAWQANWHRGRGFAIKEAGIEAIMYRNLLACKALALEAGIEAEWWA